MKLSVVKSILASFVVLTVISVSAFALTDVGRSQDSDASDSPNDSVTAAEDSEVAGPTIERDDVPDSSASEPASSKTVSNDATGVATSKAAALALAQVASPTTTTTTPAATPALTAPAPIGFFTGDVAADFPASDPDVVIIEDPGGLGDVGVPLGFPRRSGFEMEDLRFRYDSVNDELSVGLNFHFIGGDADNDGNTATAPIDLPAGGGFDIAEWGNGEAFSVVFDLDNDGVGDLIAGVPQSGTIDDFVVATAFNFPPVVVALQSPATAFGTPRPELLGTSAQDTSAASPDIEFSIVGLANEIDSSLETIGVLAFAGSQSDGGFGEEFLPTQGSLTTIPNPAFDPPEPLVPGISVVKSVNGNDANTELEADTFEIGTTIEFDFLVTNIGELDLTDVALTDDVLGDITCPETELAVGASMTCEATTVVTEGLTTNIATVNGQPVDEDGIPVGDSVTDDDPANHIGATTTISIEKATNGEDADDPTGPSIEAGDDVTFTYVVTNSGPLSVIDLVVTDDIEGDVCTIARLDAGASETCELLTNAGIGQYANTGNVVGQPVDQTGSPVGDPLSDDDPSHHIGVCSNLFEGPALYRGNRTIWNTTLEVADDSRIVLQTSENGASPGQPNEQVYLEIAGNLYGPSKLGLGTITIDVEEGGQIRVLHISEVETDVTGANSVVPALCGSGITEIEPVCTGLVTGPNLYRGSQTIWQPGLIAEDNSTVRVVTTEHGASPDQPHEQVYLEVGGNLYGPTFEGLGDIQFDITDGGEITILHISEVETDVTGPNSVIPSICGDAVSAIPGPTCPSTVTGPRMWQGSTTTWDSGLSAEAGSTITVVTSDNVSNAVQPNEQVFLQVGTEIYGPTPAGRGVATFDIDNTGELTVLHFSEVQGRQSSANSVEFTLCGSGLFESVDDHS